ncbi:unnamed protein product [Medioppia subpectinata]|uniref:Uncharacterized protein n=1 Tax=Medioppia subpectinata TaxID=1979941 RepID=A0A7R9KFE6_9ACAR|nr:unnamed protein product [Medioppia subpectinata]CAG2101347.1 unnamed protein product [Medioppia subpectinata]
MGRSASQVLQDDSTLTSVKIWGKRSIMKCRLRCAYSCLDLAQGIKQLGRSSKVSDKSNTSDTFITEKLKTSNTLKVHKWHLWRRFFRLRDDDVMTRKETKLTAKKTTVQRRNAGLFVTDYEEEQTVGAKIVDKESLELCDLEDSGHHSMNAKDTKDGK